MVGFHQIRPAFYNLWTSDLCITYSSWVTNKEHHCSNIRIKGKSQTTLRVPSFPDWIWIQYRFLSLSSVLCTDVNLQASQKRAKNWIPWSSQCFSLIIRCILLLWWPSCNTLGSGFSLAFRLGGAHLLPLQIHTPAAQSSLIGAASLQL